MKTIKEEPKNEDYQVSRKNRRTKNEDILSSLFQYVMDN